MRMLMCKEHRMVFRPYGDKKKQACPECLRLWKEKLAKAFKRRKKA